MKSKFKCIECGAEYPLDEIRFKCDCGDLLEVISDLESFGRSGEDWRREFDSRSDLVAFARYKDLLLPDLPDDEIDLVLSGHTHGGQVGLVSFGRDWTVLSRTRWPDHGLFARGRSRLYVHRGTGFYGFPLRVGVPGEASVLELVLR